MNNMSFKIKRKLDVAEEIISKFEAMVTLGK